MAMSFDFKPIQYNDLTGRIRNANKDFYSSIGGMIEGVGTGAKDIASAHTAEEERKKREEEEKKKWDHMLEQEAYQRNRDAINDARYFAEQQRIAAKEKEERIRREEGLKNFRAAINGAYTPEYLSSLGPAAQARYKAALASPDLSTAMQNIGAIETIDYQKHGLDSDYNTKQADKIVNEFNDYTARSGIRYGKYADLPTTNAELNNLRVNLINLRDYMNKNIPQHTILSSEKIREINETIAAIEKKLNYKKPPSKTDASLGKYRKNGQR
ncbi:MAG: hypothetical protein J6U20_09890 [Fibrobacter sp.]|nr:hypothetical protein [Fibrobacter sp.]